MAESVSSDFVRQVRMALEVLAGQTAMSPSDELSPLVSVGASAKAYLSARMDTQSTDLTTADHVEFDDVLVVDASGDIALSSGGGNQTDGLITLAANKVYALIAGFKCDFSTNGGAVRVRLRNNTLAAEFGSQAEMIPNSATGNSNEIVIASGIVETGAAPEVIEARITGVFQLASFRGAGAVGNSFLLVVEIG